MRMKRIWLLSCICMFLFHGFCYGASPIPGELKEGETSIKLGGPMEDMLKFFGPPTRIAANGENYCWRDLINLYGPELIIKAKHGKTVWCIVVDRVPMVRTPEGIGVGSKKEEIEAQYGEGKGYTDLNGDIILSYGGEKAQDPFLRFRLSGKKEKTVSYMILGNPGVGASDKGKNAKGKKKKS